MSEEIAPRSGPHRLLFAFGLMLFIANGLIVAGYLSHASQLGSDRMADLTEVIIDELGLLLFLGFLWARRGPVRLVGILSLAVGLTFWLSMLWLGIDTAATFTDWGKIGFLEEFTLFFGSAVYPLVITSIAAYGVYLLVFSRELRAWPDPRNRR